ncbi:MAG: tRNA (adenosine(37)-N6)-dimethylallyltransferase MiaA [Lachnospiraceae bacterium]|nr:tRNA (adenosine(37)-N6)-dimethylallyltransferase MiaA [Lachnospiraceae bacterium]
MSDKKSMVILTGPTAAGKTGLSIRLAKEINAEIVSADSVQVYRDMNIGSAKITSEEMQGIPHHLIDVLDPTEDMNVARFKELSLECCRDIWSRGRIPLITGGTGFYIQALLYDVDFGEEEDDGYGAYLEKLCEEQGSDALYELLKNEDAEAAEKIHPNNIKRVIRALIYKHNQGEKISEHNERESAKESPYNFAYFVLDMDRAKLYERIDLRVDQMMEQGLYDEVKSLIEKYTLDRSSVSMQALGYKEFFDVIDGSLDLEEAVRIIKRDTRHFAKRQLTWFKRERDVIRVDKDAFTTEDEQLKFIKDILYEKGIIE